MLGKSFYQANSVFIDLTPVLALKVVIHVRQHSQDFGMFLREWLARPHASRVNAIVGHDIGQKADWSPIRIEDVQDPVARHNLAMPIREFSE
jgi:hypothetical protein